MLKIRLIRSRIGATPGQRRVLDALGLRRMHKIREFRDTAPIRGMIGKVSHMVEVVS
ncbi:MAG: 50S ribosomal protein L30 [Desulfovibrio sp.]|jgi:large subunit ribosomal protein L30|nr:50S ribosomal protein L30 [Desulfovibrio sp.]